MVLLDDPNIVAGDGYTAMSGSLWFYMTPQSPKPSMHEVVTGFFKPNTADSDSNLTASFATTNNIINGALECGQGIGVDSKVQDRASYFLSWL